MRNWLPGRIGRRAALGHVLDRVRAQCGQHVGRARGDLQQRLTETSRAFSGTLAARYGDYTDRLTQAISTARQASMATRDEQNLLRDDLRARGELLDELRTALDDAREGTRVREPSGAPPNAHTAAGRSDPRPHARRAGP